MHIAPRRLSLLIICALLIADLLLLPFSALSFAVSTGPVLLGLGLLYVAGRLVAQGRPRHPGLWCFGVELYLLLLFGAVGFVFSYLVVERGWVVRDDVLARIDQWLGFDWPAYARFVLQHDVLRYPAFVLYVAAPLLVGMVVLRRCLQGDCARASEVVAMVMVGGLLCVILSGLFPSVGGSGYFPVDNDFYEGRQVVFDTRFRELFLQLRAGGGMQVDLLKPTPLIAFPSYHACLALLVILACWRADATGRVMAGISVLSMFTLPVDGGHHLADIFGGLLVGVMAYGLVARFCRGHADGTVVARG